MSNENKFFARPVFSKEGMALFHEIKPGYKQRLDNLGIFDDKTANILAAAPELLAACEIAVRLVIDAASDGEWDKASMDKIRAAIARARNTGGEA